VYERAGLGGGLGYTEDRLRILWDRPPFSLRVLRQMNQADGQGPANRNPRSAPEPANAGSPRPFVLSQLCV
jgi:hypothetical protein